MTDRKRELAARRQAIRTASRAPTERRVYLIPVETVDRVLDYQAARGLPSEVAAVRALLDEALKARGM